MRKQSMTEGKIAPSIFWFALPIMGGLLLQMLYNTVDGIVVGNFVGEGALASVNTSGSFVNLLISISNGIGGGSSVYLAQLYGAKREEKLHRAMSTMVLLMLFMGLMLTLIGELSAPMVLQQILNVPEDTYQNALLYLRIYLLGLIFMCMYNGIASALRAIGDSKAAMFMLVVSSVINIILDLAFVIVFHLGVAGVAIATVAAQGFALLACAFYIRKYQPILAISPKEITFEWETCVTYLKAGIPMSIQFMISNMGTIAVQRLVNSYGTTFMASVAAAAKIEQYSIVPIMSFAQSMTVFSGQNIGAGKLDRVKKGLHSAWAMSVTGCLVLALILIFGARPLIMMFGCRGESLAIGIEYLHFIPFVLFFAVFQFVTRCMLQGAGDITVPMVITFITLACRVASAYAMAATPIGYRAVWMATAVDFALGSCLNILRMRSGKWKAKKMVKN